MQDFDYNKCDITDKDIDRCPCQACREACKLATELMKDENIFLALWDDPLTDVELLLIISKQ